MGKYGLSIHLIVEHIIKDEVAISVSMDYPYILS